MGKYINDERAAETVRQRGALTDVMNGAAEAATHYLNEVIAHHVDVGTITKEQADVMLEDPFARLYK